jgi:glycosyltransferase involved in cell wall biosynthesis
VIYNGMDQRIFFPDEALRNKTRKELGYKETDFVIGNVGVLSVRKGQIYLLKAINKIRRNFPKVKVLLVGSIREHELDIYNEMLDYINEKDLSYCVKIIDTIPNVNEIYNSLDLFVMSSVTEGFGLSAFEAMLACNICIFSDIPVYREIITEDKTGFFFESKNSNSLAEVLTKVLNNIHDYKDMKISNRKFVLENFTLKKMVEKYDKLYKSSL